MLSKKLETLLEEFDGAAQNWGYQMTEGYGNSVGESSTEYNERRKDLVGYLEKLEASQQSLRKKLKR